ncbi:hypothetical protein [Streptomyces sp. NPDC087856]|uniref:hypothetical protein n=1 Tax=Streptomyces sp. NPDC087856 TaxID=3365811 RepID=UPI003821B923
MNSALIIVFIIALTGVVSASLTYAKKLADQVPELLESFGKARAAWDDFKRKGDEPPAPELPPQADDEEPPSAA